MTKTEYKQHKADWNKALGEGRVLNFPTLHKMCAYPTLTMRNAAIAQAQLNAVECFVSTVKL